jgi:hypothetical protein
LVLNAIEDDDRIEEYRDLMGRLSGALARDNIEDRSRGLILDAHQSLLNAANRLRFPWAKAAADHKPIDAAQARADYSAAFQIDLDSPEGQARIAAQVAALERVRVKKRG